ncbi:MAG: hypothetical protein KF811_00415 [Dokdonella sp.]|nr:hypothetical protein [Dokdonella sp.]MCB1577696.1 hypothetical protein [Xanthomonadales bacterium]
MTDFELRRELRELRVSREPQRDLWPQIAHRLAAGSEQPAAPARRRAWMPLALAAGIAVALSAGLFSLVQHHQAAVDDTAMASLRDGPSVSEQIERARELASSGDPRLAGAEVVIDSASEELEQALQQRPDAVFLVGLINRTHAQRRKLARLGINAG